MSFFLKKFPSTEWSGPAWYKPHFKKGDKFPIGFTLIHFHPVDLGHGTATTIEAGDTAKILEYTWKNYPETEKCMMGIIHSHHSMGAFFSGTDKSCIEDNSPIKNFYCSTVVASEKDKFAFAFGYLDQYNKNHIVEADYNDIKIQMPKSKEEGKWKTIAKKLEKDKKDNTIQYSSFNNGNRFTQTSLSFNNLGHPIDYQSVDKANSENPDVNTIHNIRFKADMMNDPDSAYISLLYEAYANKEILYETFVEEITDSGMNPNVIINELNKEGVYNVPLLTEASTK